MSLKMPASLPSAHRDLEISSLFQHPSPWSLAVLVSAHHSLCIDITPDPQAMDLAPAFHALTRFLELAVSRYLLTGPATAALTDASCQVEEEEEEAYPWWSYDQIKTSPSLNRKSHASKRSSLRMLSRPRAGEPRNHVNSLHSLNNTNNARSHGRRLTGYGERWSAGIPSKNRTIRHAAEDRNTPPLPSQSSQPSSSCPSSSYSFSSSHSSRRTRVVRALRHMQQMQQMQQAHANGMATDPKSQLNSANYASYGACLNWPSLPLPPSHHHQQQQQHHTHHTQSDRCSSPPSPPSPPSPSRSSLPSSSPPPGSSGSSDCLRDRDRDRVSRDPSRHRSRRERERSHSSRKPVRLLVLLGPFEVYQEISNPSTIVIRVQVPSRVVPDASSSSRARGSVTRCQFSVFLPQSGVTLTMVVFYPSSSRCAVSVKPRVPATRPNTASPPPTQRFIVDPFQTTTRTASPNDPEGSNPNPSSHPHPHSAGPKTPH